jgi:ectoine hydroxylase-related dioxygenase (phytanoyl-CoA dioxygenase family)
LIFCKYAHDPAFVAWHQDTVYSNLHLTPSVSAWIALLDSVPENGCMRVVTGSHVRGILPHQELHSPDNLLRRGEEILVKVEDSEATDVVLQAGEMSLHHNSIIHGSRANGSDKKRIGFIVRFVTPEYDLPQPNPFLRARGNAACSHLKLAEPPVDRDLHEMVDAWRRVN